MWMIMLGGLWGESLNVMIREGYVGRVTFGGLGLKVYAYALTVRCIWSIVAREVNAGITIWRIMLEGFLLGYL